MGAMNPEVKAKWLEALRSGKYKQGRMQLRNNEDGYCCLGVLCDVVAPDKWVRTGLRAADEQWEHQEPDDYEERNAYTLLTDLYADTLGLSGEQQGILSRKNDNGATFAEIADYIEEKL